MCGIAGWIAHNGFPENKDQTLQNMSLPLNRRGPDAFGEYLDGEAALLHRRLIVVDPEGGLQPMTAKNRGETYTLIYNGELYNTEEIRTELLIKGYTFSGHSDTEVLLYSYIEWGKDCLQKLNGIFAFAVWESRAKTLFIARDRMGVKPLFFYRYSGGLLFASELKSLLSNPLVKRQIDREGLRQILLLGPAKTFGSGVIKGLEELKPAEYLIYTKDSLQIKQYWKLTAKPHLDDAAQTVDKTRELITDAVQKQLVSDVPLACFLSGGLDSSIISFIAAKKYRAENKTLTTYSVDYENNDKFFVKNNFQPTADNDFIKLMSGFIGSSHQNIVLDSLEVAESLKEATDARDLPGMADIDSSLLLFCREIKKQNTVCLSGECADEIFGGYPWYHNQDILFAESFPWSNSTKLRKSLFTEEALGSGSGDFVHEQYLNTVKLTDYLDTDDKLHRRMREMFVLNFYWFMQTLLDRKDRMSMYSGLEVRVPFCDHRLVEYAYNMPWNLKSLNGREKGIVREAFKGILPDAIIERKKSPYPKTFNPVFLEYVKTEVKKVMEKGSILNEIVNKDFLKQLTQDNYPLKDPWYGQLMRLPQIFAYLLQIHYFFERYELTLV